MFRTERVSLLKQSDKVLTWDDGIRLLNYVEDNKEVCMCACRSIGYDSLRHMFFESIRKMLQNFIGHFNEEDDDDPKDTEFITEFYTQAFAGCLLDPEWHERDSLRTDPSA